MLLLLIFSVLLALIAAFFALQNAIPVTVSFLTYQFEGSLAVVLLGTLAAGVLIAVLLLLPFNIKKTLTISSLRKKVKNLEKECHQLKNPGSSEPSVSEAPSDS